MQKFWKISSQHAFSDITDLGLSIIDMMCCLSLTKSFIQTYSQLLIFNQVIKLAVYVHTLILPINRPFLVQFQ